MIAEAARVAGDNVISWFRILTDFFVPKTKSNCFGLIFFFFFFGEVEIISKFLLCPSIYKSTYLPGPCLSVCLSVCLLSVLLSDNHLSDDLFLSFSSIIVEISSSQ